MIAAALLLVAQTASAAPADIELRASVTAKRVQIEQQGTASLTVRADPDGGSDVKVDSPPAAGKRTRSNVRVTIDAQARVADRSGGETTPR